MRKRFIPNDRSDAPSSGQWLDVQQLAEVEITSEQEGWPIEAALVPGRGSGWRAKDVGTQVIRLLFDTPLRLQRILLRFEEHDSSRTQEFLLRWSPDRGKSYHEIVRQQYHFSPPATTSEQEDYRVNLDGVTALELKIIPDIDGGEARASLAQLRLE